LGQDTLGKDMELRRRKGQTMTMSKSFAARNGGVAANWATGGRDGAPATTAKTTIDGKVFGLANGKSFVLSPPCYPFILRNIPFFHFTFLVSLPLQLKL